MIPQHAPKAYLKSSLNIVFALLAVWFLASFGCAILFRDWLDANFPKVGNAPFGFWMSQQGAIITFILLLIVYRFLMNRLDAKHGLVDPAGGATAASSSSSASAATGTGAPSEDK